MQPVISPQEAARLDDSASEPVATLMDRAGRAVARAALQMGAGYGTRVAVLAGPGNNGGDGYVAARYLARRGVDVAVRALDEPRTDVSRAAQRAALTAGLRTAPLTDLIEADLVIDALFGGGFRRGLPDEVKSWLDSPAPVVAVDVPSGLDAGTGRVEDEAFSAQRTVTFHARKTGHVLGQGPDLCGDVEVADIGLQGGDPTYWLAEEADAPLPVRPRTAHKWSAGSVLVAGGAPGMVGAALLAGRAALHLGAGAVGVAVPAEASATAQAAAPELLHYSLDQLPERFQVLVVGPGLGPGREETVRTLLNTWRGPVVVDADALTAIDPGRRLDRGPVVATPHQGEFRRLAGEDPTPEAATKLSQATGVIVLLKGNPTWIADGSTPVLVTSGGAELATIGTGDVLAGMLGALLAAGQPPEVAARSAAYWHGRAGADLARHQRVTANALATHIGRFR
ncbi:MAG TPA: NAD(P)H-hydrate dehydratase [Acidimicrobiia bacterium]|nr:NAD(P)H-hydrate dehydratase [Acidimicrobiia bacterium]